MDNTTPPPGTVNQRREGGVLGGEHPERGIGQAGPRLTTFKDHASFYRFEVKHVAGGLAHFIQAEKARPHDSVAPNPDRGEMVANLILAYRHLEDASMRLGKAMQANDAGTSVYDDSTVGAPSAPTPTE